MELEEGSKLIFPEESLIQIFNTLLVSQNKNIAGLPDFLFGEEKTMYKIA